MEKRYKIGLFFVLLLISVLVVVLLYKRNSVDRLSEKNNLTKQHLNMDELSQIDPQTSKAAEDLYQVQKMNVQTTSDTVCIYENIDKKDGSVSMEEGKIPVKYIGLNREELEKMLAADSLAPTLEEKQKGFKSQHLELFSADKIKVLRIYDTAQGESGFYIMEVEGEVCVFEHDKKTLYFKTGLHPENLPVEVRLELQEGKFMDNELQVYHFIESYSS